jgi:type 1 glutamine amidotransferase
MQPARSLLLLTAVCLAAFVANGLCLAADAPHVVFVTGDDEYGSEVSMPMIAKILEAHHGMKTTVLYATNEKGEHDRHANNIPGLDALKTADSAVFFMRWRALPQGQLDAIIGYAQAGKPMIGLRTASHAFKYPGPPNDKWNAGFAETYWGQSWISHYGHENSTEAYIVSEKADHPILRGLEREFWLHSWLYLQSKDDDKMAPDCKVLLVGDALKGFKPGGEKFGERQPLAWTRELKREDGKVQRTFYTSLGHPRDFSLENPRRLLVNAIYWSMGRAKDIPKEGANVEIVGEYNPPDPH